MPYHCYTMMCSHATYSLKQLKMLLRIGLYYKKTYKVKTDTSTDYKNIHYVLVTISITRQISFINL